MSALPGAALQGRADMIVRRCRVLELRPAVRGQGVGADGHVLSGNPLMAMKVPIAVATWVSLPPATA